MTTQLIIKRLRKCNLFDHPRRPLSAGIDLTDIAEAFYQPFVYDHARLVVSKLEVDCAGREPFNLFQELPGNWAATAQAKLFE
ncbi:hypothetical protein AA0472_0481 [Acetobacter estunensis NRIC 0472]|nr:hypothetical protein AA0472_0481 [Acetobacter estunensis NRIC 0472]